MSRRAINDGTGAAAVSAAAPLHKPKRAPRRSGKTPRYFTTSAPTLQTAAS